MRRILRTVVGVLTAAIAVFCLLASLLSFFGAEQQRNADRRIDEVFRQASRFVSDFRANSGRLPLQSEFAAWVAAQPEGESGSFSVHHVSYQHGRLPKELTHLAGLPPEPNYYLEIWRGEWSEYYAPWANRSTIEPSDLEWYLGTYFSIGILFLLIASGFLFIIYKVMSSNFSSSGRAEARRST